MAALEYALHHGVAPVQLCDRCRCRRLRVAACMPVYRQLRAAAAAVQHSVLHIAVLAHGQHADAALAVQVHREVCGAEERVGHVVAVVHELHAHRQRTACGLVAWE